MSRFCRRLHGFFTTTTTSQASTRTYLPLLTRTDPPSTRTDDPPSTRTDDPPSTRTDDPPLTPPRPLTIRQAYGKSFLQGLREERDLRALVDKFKKASELYWFRREHEIYFATARRLAAANQFSWIEEILEEQKKYENITHEGFVVRIISVYGKSGMFDHAHKLFDEMPQLNCPRTVKSFNALLAACLHSENFDKFEDIFYEVPRKLSINPDVFSYNTLVKGLFKMECLDTALSAMEEMESNGVNPDSITLTTVISGLHRNGRFSDVDRVWKLMVNKGIVPCIWSYNAKLRGLVSQNRMSEAVELFEGLGTKGLKPDIFTFNALMKGFCDGGNLEGAKQCYMELEKYECAPNRQIFRMLVPFACEMGDFGWGLELANAAITRRCDVDAVTFKGVVDGLVKESRVEEAKKLVEFIQQSNGYSGYELKLPSEE